MGEQLRVRLWQHASALEPATNLADLDSVAELAMDADLVVLPEAFARDFGESGSDLAPYAETLDGPFATRLLGVSKETDTTVVAGMFECSPDPARPFNTLVAAQPSGVTAYRNIHLYDSFGYRESDRVHPGPLTPTIIDVASVKVGLMTCYDLRFPELARALSADGAQVLVVPAAWIAGPGKLDHWRILLRARAIENLLWVVAAAQPAPRYTGHSMVIAPTGDVVAEAGEGEESLSAVLDLSALTSARHDNPSLDNRRL